MLRAIGMAATGRNHTSHGLRKAMGTPKQNRRLMAVAGSMASLCHMAVRRIQGSNVPVPSARSALMRFHRVNTGVISQPAQMSAMGTKDGVPAGNRNKLSTGSHMPICAAMRLFCIFA